jgi:polyisoprenyl-phosphate glycosyltransferase
VKGSVVVPVYRNEPTLPELLRQLAEVHERSFHPFEVVFVVDGSPDNSYALLKLRLGEMPFPSQLIALSRNFGSFAAIRAGMAQARGEFVAVLAADLQQPVPSVAQFFAVLERGADIVVGQRASRDDPWLSQMAANVFWHLYRRFVQPQMPAGGADSFACTRQVRDVLVSLPEANSALVGLLFWVGFRRELISYPRAGRVSGKSGWTFSRKFRYAFDTAFAFSDLPITMMIIAGALGIVGGYVWRIFENTKGRPVPLVHSVEQIMPAVSAPVARESV